MEKIVLKIFSKNAVNQNENKIKHRRMFDQALTYTYAA